MTKKLGEVCEIIYGYPFDSKLFNNNQKGKPVIRIRDVVRGFSETFTTEPCDSKYWISKDDVLIGMDGDFNISTWKSSRALLNQRVCKLESGEKITNLYLRYILPTKLQGIWDKKLFTTVKHLSAKDLNSISISIPPLPEQKRIVKKIDAAFEKIDKLKANAERNLANAKDLFQSALDEAMRPKKGWVEKRLGEVGEYRKGPFGSSLTKRIFIPKNSTAIKVYEQKNAIRKTATIGEYYITREYFNSKMSGFEVLPGDIIVSCAGTIGETFIMPEDMERGIINQALMRMRIAPEVDKFYFLYYFDHILKRSANALSNGSAMKNIPPFSVFKQLLIPIPPLSEQREIVKRLDLLAEKIKILEQNYTQQIADCVEMRQAVLREAFEGRL